jgi:hypothetical protein
LEERLCTADEDRVFSVLLGSLERTRARKSEPVREHIPVGGIMTTGRISTLCTAVVLSACLPLSACNDATAPAQSGQEIGLVLDVDKSATETDGRDYDIYDRQQGRRYQYRGAGHEFTVTPNGGTPKTFVVEASFEGDLLSMLEDLSGGVA